MRTIQFEIPTMTRLHKQLEVFNSIKKLNVVNITTESGRAAVTFQDSLLKVDIIKAIEEAGYIVKY
ncbi:heavy-metal-associated domain-containing protein [Daejeonella sp.]|uniref:heavy-metal-associated domain-containing protein n=1 Tax=Daejeonella sp. TaxID=2805397 RepID=UPI0030BF187E